MAAFTPKHLEKEIVSNAISKGSKPSKRVRFSEDTKKHDGQNATTTAFGEFFEQTLM